MIAAIGAAAAYWVMNNRQAPAPIAAAELGKSESPAVPAPLPPPTLPPAAPLAPPPEVWTGHSAMIWTVAFSSDGLRALSGSGGFVRRDDQWVLSEDNAVHLWDARTGREIKVLKGFKDGIASVAFSPDGKYAVLCGSGRWKGDTYVPATDYGVRLWDVEQDRELSKLSTGPAGPQTEDASQSTARFQGHSREVFGVDFAPDGKRVLTSSMDWTIRLWDVATGRELRQMIGHVNSVYKVKFSPDGRRALSCSADKTVRLWDLETGKELQKMKGHKDYIWSVAFSPDGKFGASAGGSQQKDGKIVRGEGDYDIRLWDLETGKEVRRFQGHKATVGAVAFTPDGKYLVSTGCWQTRDDQDQSVRLWEVASGKEVRRFDGHHGSVGCVAISPDGHYALCGGYGGELRLWDISKRQ
jgi:WD40 repeat protein